MQITEKTPYSRLQPIERYLTPESVEQIKQAAERHFGLCGAITLADFFACADGDFARVIGGGEPTVLQVYWIKRFCEDFLPAFTAACESLKSPQTAKELRAMQGLKRLTMQEGMLVFVQAFFGLPSFEAAEKITLGEYILARKVKYNNDIARFNYDKISREELRRKRK